MYPETQWINARMHKWNICSSSNQRKKKNNMYVPLLFAVFRDSYYTSPPRMCGLPVLFKVVLPLEALPADLTGEREFGWLMRALMDHEVVWLGEPTLAVLAHVLTFGPHLPHAKLPAASVVLDLVHYRKHGGGVIVSLAVAGWTGLIYADISYFT